MDISEHLGDIYEMRHRALAINSFYNIWAKKSLIKETVYDVNIITWDMKPYE
jgi:hypothetical protein